MGADRWGTPPIQTNFPFFLDKNSHFSGFFRFQLCRMSGTRQSLCRVPDKKHSAKTPLPTGSLPSAALGKAFAECKLGFAECPWHSAKPLSPVVPDYQHESSLLAIFYRLRLYLVHLLESFCAAKSKIQTK